MKIKKGFSCVYAKSRDTNITKIYKKNKIMKPTFTPLITSYESGNPKIKALSSKVFRLYHTTTWKVPEKCYETVRLCILKKIGTTLTGVSKTDFCIKFSKYPHQLLRYHTKAEGPKADRISTGMKNAYGIFCGKAYKPKKEISCFLQIYLSKKYEYLLPKLKQPMKLICCKLPFLSFMRIEDAHTKSLNLKKDPKKPKIKKPKFLSKTSKKHFKA